MAQHIELNPITHLTVGTVGVPGRRTFFLQAGVDSDQISLVIEKVQAVALADSLDQLLTELSRQFPGVARQLRGVEETKDMRLKEPVDPLFRVGNLGLGFDEAEQKVVLVAYEMVAEGDEPNVISFWATPVQVRNAINQAREVVRGGRPICGNCGLPIDADGHFCAHRNGHMK